MSLSTTFNTAVNNANQIKDHVLSNQTTAINRAQSSHDTALTNIQQIAALASFLPLNDKAPQPPKFKVDLEYGLDVTHGEDAVVAAAAAAVQSAADQLKEKYKPSQIAPNQPTSIETFRPAVQSLAIPDAPDAQPLPSLPVAPVAQEVALPVRPVLNKPLMPDLVDLRLPTFTFTPLPPFNDQSPEWEGSSVSAVLQWQEHTYTPILFDEEVEVIRRMWAGGTGLPPAVEQAMWERAASREDASAARDVSAAYIDFSARGFGLPTGALVDRIDTIRSDAALRKQGLARDIAIKVADTHIENLRFACTQALAAENVMIGLWNQMAQRQFDAAKVQLDSELSLLNAHIAVYNARQAARGVDAGVRRLALEERAQDLQRMRLELDGEIAKGTINEQRVRVFSELYKALQADVDLFKAEMEGARVESDVQRNEIERYKAEVQAIGELVTMDKNRYDAYASRVQGETAKAQLLQAQGAAYSAYVSGQVANAEIAIKNQQADIAVADLGLRAYMSEIESKKAVISGSLGVANARISAMQSQTEKLAAEARIKTTGAELELKALEAAMRTETSLYEVEMRKYLASQEHTLRIAGYQLEAAKAVAQAQSTLAAGAMAGISLSTSASGGSTVNANANDIVNTSVKLPV